MINEIVRTLFKVVIFILKWFFNIILLPLKPIINLFPHFENFLTVAMNFINDYVFFPLKFGREVFLNLTGFPQELITFSVTLAMGLFGFISVLKAITFFKNMWRTFRGGE